MLVNNKNLGHAWHLFIETGGIDNEAVRPVVARSWERCKEKGLNPLLRRPNPLSDVEFKNRLKQNQPLLSAANPVIDYLYPITNNSFIALTDKEGYALKTVYEDKFPLVLGHKLTEDSIGTTSFGIALREGSTTFTSGFEHFAVRYHSYSMVATPIKDSAGIIYGVIGYGNPFGDIPISDHTLQAIEIAARLVASRLQDNVEQQGPIENNPMFMQFINVSKAYAVMVNTEDKILSANKEFFRLANARDSAETIGSPVDDYLIGNWSGKDSIGSFLAENDEFYVRGSGKKTSCSLIRKKIIATTDGSVCTLLVFRKNNEETLGNPNFSENALGAFDNLVGKHPSWTKLKKMGSQVAKYSSTILLEGETGTGKELLALAIHQESKRKRFIAINCGTIPKYLIESELFGYEDGAFTGARKGGQIGKLELADGGTLFLDEIEEMPLHMQVSLLRFLQEKTVRRIGGSRERKVNVRVIGATNRNLEEMVMAGDFREDLFYRLNVIKLELPPLRDRETDIPLIYDFLVQEICRQFKQEPLETDEMTIKILSQYDWPGNVRELRNVIERAIIFTEGNKITPDVLPLKIKMSAYPLEGQNYKLKNSESEIISKVLGKNQGNISKTALELGIARNTLYKKIKQLNIKMETKAKNN